MIDLPRLLPLAVEWARFRSQDILDTGAALTPHEMPPARSVGVKHPERVRIKIMAAVPLPKNSALRAAALQAGFFGDRSGCELPHDVATDGVREANQSRASDPPSSGECRSTNAPTIEEYCQLLEA